STDTIGPATLFNGVVWNDSAEVPVTQARYQASTPGVITAEGALAAFIGTDPNGVWTLEVVDAATLDTGKLNNWSLEIASLDAAPPSGGGGGGGTPPPGGTPPGGGTITATNLCLPVKATASKPARGNPGKVEVSVRQLQINQRIFQAAVRRANAIQAWLDAGVVEGDICGGAVSAAKLGPGIATGTLAQAQSLTPPNPRPVTPAKGRAKGNVKFELTAAQFLINQRVAQAAVRRANGLQTRLDSGLTGGDVRDGSVSQGKLNAGLAILSAQPGGQPQAATKTPIAKGSGGDPSKVKVDAAQLLISQRIGQAAIRRLNALTARLQAGLRTGDFRDASLSAADLSP
ncbi:MAG: proprotein convertase P-domain-containing protein, partial [Thermoleophilia bacterium]|nr:proprotein convertase P-domain-containing protein [Thermoleophilia bacterium]